MSRAGRIRGERPQVPAKGACPCATCVLLVSTLGFAVTLPNFVMERFRGPNVLVRDVEGIQDRVHDGKLHLTVKDFLTLLLKNNTEINMARLDVLSAADQILGAKAPFDPSVTASFNSTRSLTLQSSQIGGAQELDFLSQTTLMNYQQVLESGQTVSVGFNASRASTNSEFNFLNPYIATSTFFQVTQPLWQGRTNLQFKAPLMIARTQLLITSDQTEGRIADMVAAAASQYWDAVQSRDNIKVQQQAYDLAQKQYERDKLSLDLGALPSLDIFQSQSQLAQRKVAVIQAQYAYRDALDGLRRLIGADLNPDTRNIEIVLEDNPVAVVAPVRADGGSHQRRAAKTAGAERGQAASGRERFECASGARFDGAARRLAGVRRRQRPGGRSDSRDGASGHGANDIRLQRIRRCAAPDFRFSVADLRFRGECDIAGTQQFRGTKPGGRAGEPRAGPLQRAAARAASDPAGETGDQPDPKQRGADRGGQDGARSGAKERGSGAAEIRARRRDGLRSSGCTVAAGNGGKLAAASVRGLSEDAHLIPAGGLDTAGRAGDHCRDADRCGRSKFTAETPRRRENRAGHTKP